MKAIKVFLIGIAIWFLSLFITVYIFQNAEIVSGSIVFMGIIICVTHWLNSQKIKSKEWSAMVYERAF